MQEPPTEDWRTPGWIRLGLSDDAGTAGWRAPSVCLQAEILDKVTVDLHSRPRYSKPERQAFGGRLTVPAHSASPARTPAWATDVSPPPKTKPGRPADPRKTLGWITAAATAAVRAKEDALRATVPAAPAQVPTATAQVPAAKCASATAAGRVVVAAAHVDINTHYQTADGGVHPLPPGCGARILLR